MKQDLYKKDKTEIIVLANNLDATLKKISKLYIKSKTENNYLKRRNRIVEDRLKHMKDLWEKKNSCHITFERIDAQIKREKKLDKRIDIEFEDKGNKNRLPVNENFESNTRPAV